MATAANRAALQTALLSVRGLRRRRLGHIGPNHYPQNDLDKWGRKTNTNGNNNGMPSNLLGLGGGRRPAPRASLVLGGENAISRRKNGLSKHRMNNGGGDNNNGNGKRLGVTMMEQQRASITSRRQVVNGASSPSSSSATSGVQQQQQQLRNVVNGTPSPNKQDDDKPSQGGYSSDLVVVLDMDECLVHSQFLSDQLVDKYRQVEDRPSSNSKKGNNEEAFIWSTCDSFRIKLPDGDLVNVNKRPNLDLFLKEITSKFETYIFTAAMEVYASPVLNKIDPTGDMFAGRLYREHCTFDPDMGVYAKNLCNVLRMRKMMINNGSTDHKEITTAEHDDAFPCDERRVVLVDNNPLSFLPNPSNGILVSSFYDDPKDDTLEAVMELLHELDESEDVRPILDDRFGLKEALDDVVRDAAVGW
mmetsp:Transcript_32941/g.62942  ORF Transcript_32941/g.62942 Transcript_32941/m.62942 type:complete len:417 (-) Transcript_32941:89-1339(-)